MIPHIAKDERGIKTLYVDGKPYICLAGELHNSSSSNIEYMESEVWKYLDGSHINTILLPVAWETIEAVEGTFDFSIVDALISQARAHNIKLIILWFGLWKNAESFYTPEWVKRDRVKYFRALQYGGIPSDSISPLCNAAVDADAKAFAALMKHIREIDNDHTVIMMQVENEIGLIRSERDFSDAANAAYAAEIPESMAKLFGKSGDWYTAFGEDAPEYFMAYHYAIATDKITAAGKAEYNLPMFVNAALNNRFPGRPGGYPSGGPVAHVLPIWINTSTHVDAFAPDIYLPYFKDLCEAFTQHENPLLIPETLPMAVSASNVFYAVGAYHAICFAPFGIDSMFNPNTSFGGAELLSKSYAVLSSLLSLLLEHRGTNRQWSFLKRDEQDQGVTFSAAHCDITVTYADSPFGAPGQPPIPNQTPKARNDSGGIIFEVEPNVFICTGCRFSVKFLPKRGSNSNIMRLYHEEGEFINGEWIRRRVLNGDEGYNLTIGDSASIIKAAIDVQ